LLKKILFAVSVLVVLLSIAAVVFEYLGHHHLVFHGIFRNSRDMADWIMSFGAGAVLISIIVMIIQAIATPVPLFLVAGANGFIFGVAWGIVITLVGALLGSTVAFFLARFIARDYFYKRLARYMSKVNEMSSKSGARVVFLARLIPILPSSIVSYAAGLSKVSFTGFFIASVFGKLPEIVIYTVLGNSLSRARGLTTKVTLAVVIISLILFSLQSKRVARFFKNLFKKKAPIE